MNYYGPKNSVPSYFKLRNKYFNDNQKEIIILPSRDPKKQKTNILYFF